MKVIITGATGRVGRAAVRKCLDNDRITELVILTRRAVSGDIESHPKVDLVMHHDFTTYSDDLLQRLQGAEACIWAIGVRSEQPRPDPNMRRRVVLDLPVAAARTFCESLADKTPGGVGFRFIYCSPRHTATSKKALIFASATRKLANELESRIASIANAHVGAFEAYTLRPAAFAPPGSLQLQPRRTTVVTVTGPIKRLSFYGLAHAAPVASIDPARVGKVMAMIASDGHEGKVMENKAILTLSS